MIRLCAFADESGTALCDQIAEMKKHGISLLELRSIGGRNVADFTDEEAQNYAKELRDAGIRVFSIGSPLGKVDLEKAPEHMEKVRRVCRIAQIFGAKRVRIFSFYHAYENREAVFSALREMCAIAKEAGVRFYHENEKEIFDLHFDRFRARADARAGSVRLFTPTFRDWGSSMTRPTLCSAASRHPPRCRHCLIRLIISISRM